MENLPDIENWITQNLRLTAFHVSESDIEPVQKWEETVGELPENSISQPRAGILEESGQFGSGVLSLRMIPGRIDWNYLSAFPTETIPESFLNVGIFTDAIETFQTKMLTWLDSCPNIKRLAFGANLVLPSESHNDAYNLLNGYLHAVEVDSESSDFTYSVNRRRSSEIQIPNLKVNRLSKWRAIKMMYKADGLDEDSIFGVSLELDINTVPSDDLKITKEYFPSLFSELIRMAIEIVEKGDIK